MSIQAFALLTAVTLAQAPTPGGLSNLQPADPRTKAFESEVLGAINARRQALQQEPVPMDERLRAFAHSQAGQASTGEGSVASAEAAMKAQNLAPLSHRLQFEAAPTAAAAVASLQHDAPTFFKDDFARGAVGAFYVPDKHPYFQLVVLFVQELDPMMGKPGLASSQTDPIMQKAEPALVACYNTALRANPNLRGDILLQLTIDGQGHVNNTNMLKSLNVGDLDVCLSSAARGLNFPLPYKHRPVTLLHPMRFIPPQGDKRIGVLSADQVQSGFAVAAADLQQCYVNRLKVVPKLVGTLTLAAVVKPDGGVQTIDVLHDELKDLPLTQCVMARAQQLHFAAPRGGGEAQVTYPLHFGS